MLRWCSDYGPAKSVTALTGVVVTVRAGRVQFGAPQHLLTSSGPIDVLPGQTLYLLTYQGEGFTKVWFNGKVYEDVDASSFMNGACADARIGVQDESLNRHEPSGGSRFGTRQGKWVGHASPTSSTGRTRWDDPA